MMRILNLLFLSFILLNAKDISFEKIFQDLNINGTLVITNLAGDKFYIYNPKRAKTRFCPASTFKIPHTLIILNENLIASKDATIEWDRIQREYEVWNRNQTLQTAIQTSCVWCYKQFSQKISKETYKDYLLKFDYGNKRVGQDKSSFWLNNDLKISALEQIEFLKKLYNESLPISKDKLHLAKEMLIIEKNEQFILRAKSGWDGIVGWYVGYVETPKEVYFFVLNMDVEKEKLDLREEIIYRALKSKSIL